MRLRVFSVLCAATALAMLLPACRTAGFRRAYAALDAQGNRRRNLFFTDTQAIYCIGELTSGRDDVTVSAVIRSKSRYSAAGQLVPVVDVYGAGEQAPGRTTLALAAFTMTKAPIAESSTSTVPQDALPFPAGEFVCDLSVDGVVEETVPFSIDYPACPTVPVAPTIPCRGWVQQGAVCPAATPNTSCTCAASGTWECTP